MFLFFINLYHLFIYFFFKSFSVFSFLSFTSFPSFPSISTFLSSLFFPSLYLSSNLTPNSLSLLPPNIAFNTLLPLLQLFFPTLTLPFLTSKKVLRIYIFQFNFCLFASPPQVQFRKSNSFFLTLACQLDHLQFC